MNSNRIFLASGGIALLAIIAALALAARPSPPPSASPAKAQRIEPHPGPSPTLTAAVAEAGVDGQLDARALAKASQPDGPFVVKRILPISGPIKYGEWHWDEKGVPEGPIVVTVDLDARVLSVFRNGYEIGAAAVLLGTEDHPTPLGVFPISQKQKEHYSNIYDGAPMPYMQRLTNDGITLHGSKVELGYASHGCVGMPNDFAAKLFATTHLGDKVYVTRGKRIGMGDSLVGS